MRKIVFVVLVFIVSTALHGQVVITYQLPGTGIYTKNQLWNLSVINTSEEINCRLELLLTDVSNNQPVLSATSQNFILKKGATLVTPTSLSPIIYNVLSPGYGIDANPNTFLPIGVFNICFRVIRIGSDYTERIAEECETVEITPIGPPILTLPYDEEKVESTRPLFIWLPPAPQNLFSGLLYDLKLVEVNQGQSSSAAIQNNLPVFTQSNIALTSQIYPAGNPELSIDKLYAWQITAKNNSSPVVQSDIWVFKVKKYTLDSNASKVSGEYYARLRPENDASYVICNGMLLFELTNELNQSSLPVKIVDLSSASRPQLQLENSTIQVNLGKNFIKLDLSESGLIDHHIYQLTVQLSERETWYLKFEYRTPDNNQQ